MKEKRDEELGQEDELEVLEARRLDGDEEEGREGRALMVMEKRRANGRKMRSWD